MSTVNLSAVFRKDKETKYGIKPQISIKTTQHGDKWLSSFKTKGTEDWENGMEVQINVQENGEFMNFSPVGGASSSSASVSSDVLKRIEALEAEVFPNKVASPPANAPTGETVVEVMEEGLDNEF